MVGKLSFSFMLIKTHFWIYLAGKSYCLNIDLWNHDFPIFPLATGHFGIAKIPHLRQNFTNGSEFILGSFCFWFDLYCRFYIAVTVLIRAFWEINEETTALLFINYGYISCKLLMNFMVDSNFLSSIG